MYIFLLIVIATFILSIFSTNWPFKLSHHLFLKKLATEWGVQPVKHGLFLSGVYSELSVECFNKPIIIRFLEGSADALYANSGLEIRIRAINWDGIAECYRINRRKQEWGEFKRVFSGEPEIDRTWLILSPETQKTEGLFKRDGSKKILGLREVNQLLFNKNEAVIQLRQVYTVRRLKAIAETLAANL
ncbi:MAG TPA: hypothetical protein VHP30_15510 [Ignavibacteriales bacterium]|nr:hypothetical protein [Ignavibacteriales bacterium]